MSVFAIFALAVATWGLSSDQASAPSFTSYPAVVLNGHRSLSLPVLKTREERQFGTVLRNAVTKGYGVVEGGTERERPGPNFGGHYVLVQWSCGLDCSEAAVIDIQDGTVLALPLPSANEHPHDFRIETGPGDLRNLRFKTDSYLLGIPNVVDGKVHYYVLNGHTWKDLQSASQQGIQAMLTASRGFFGDPSLAVITLHLLNNMGKTVRTRPKTWRLVIDGQESPDPGGQLWTGGRPLSG